MNIVLTGFMASGKSTVSEKLAKLTGRKLIDTDKYIEEKEGTSINEIFKTHGEKYFRELEKAAVRTVADEENAVISTGGGTVLDKLNIDCLKKTGNVFYLAPDFEIIEKRIIEASRTRPLLQNQSIEDIRKRFNDRIPFYENCDYRLHITEDMSVDDCAKKILDLMGE